MDYNDIHMFIRVGSFSRLASFFKLVDKKQWCGSVDSYNIMDCIDDPRESL